MTAHFYNVPCPLQFFQRNASPPGTCGSVHRPGFPTGAENSGRCSELVLVAYLVITSGREMVSKTSVKLDLTETFFFFFFEVINYVVPTIL